MKPFEKLTVRPVLRRSHRPTLACYLFNRVIDWKEGTDRRRSASQPISELLEASHSATQKVTRAVRTQSGRIVMRSVSPDVLTPPQRPIQPVPTDIQQSNLHPSLPRLRRRTQESPLRNLALREILRTQHYSER